MIDTHSHLYADEFKDDLQELIKKSRGVGIDKNLTVGQAIQAPTSILLVLEP